MKRKLKDPIQWLVQNLKRLFPDDLQLIAKEDPKVFYPINYWSLVKLIFLSAYINDVYCKILKNFWKGDLIYVDPLCQSGLDKLDSCEKCEKDKKLCTKCKRFSKNTQDVLGSAIIAAKQPAFNELFFVDLDPKKENIPALEKRIKLLDNGQTHKKCNFYSADCNTVIGIIITRIKKHAGPHTLFFIDNQGLNATWATIEKILELNSDIIINYPTAAVNRTIGLAKGSNGPESLTAFFGEDVIKKGIKEEDLLSFYMQKMSGTNRICIKIKIKGTHSFSYDLIICCRKTKSKNPYLTKYVEGYLKKQIEGLDPRTIEIGLDQLQGKTHKLSEWNQSKNEFW